MSTNSVLSASAINAMLSALMDEHVVRYTNGRKISMVNVKGILRQIYAKCGARVGDNIEHRRGTLITDRDSRRIDFQCFAGAFRVGIIFTVKDSGHEAITVVAKVPHDEYAYLSGYPTADEQTEQEVAILKKIAKEDKMHFVDVYNVGKLAGRSISVMEFVDNVGNYCASWDEEKKIDYLANKYGFADMHSGNYGGTDHFIITDVGL